MFLVLIHFFDSILYLRYVLIQFLIDFHQHITNLFLNWFFLPLFMGLFSYSIAIIHCFYFSWVSSTYLNDLFTLSIYTIFVNMCSLDHYPLFLHFILYFCVFTRLVFLFAHVCDLCSRSRSHSPLLEANFTNFQLFHFSFLY